MKNRLTLIITAICGMYLATAGQAQIITNGSFETGASTLDYSVYGGIGLAANQLPGSGEWAFVNNLAASTVWTSKSGAFNTDTAGYFGPAQDGGFYVGIQTGADQAAASASIYQAITGLSIGQQYQINGFIRARDTASTSGNFQLTTSNEGLLLSTSPASDTVWTAFTGTFTAAQTTDTVNFTWLHTTSVDQTVLFDNITIAAIPEPPFYAIIGFAGVFLLGLRRRKA